MRVLASCVVLLAGLATPTLLWAAAPPADPGATASTQPTITTPAATSVPTTETAPTATATTATTPAAGVPAAEATAAPKPRAHAAASGSVSIAGFAFSPSSLTVSQGDTVSWANSDSTAHTATASDGSFDTGTIAAGGSASHTFTKAGTFAYACSIHPNMHGTITVTASAASTGSSGSSDSSSDPSGSSGSSASSSSSGSGSSLPVTGLDALLLGAMGLALLAGGLLLRRRTPPTGDSD